MSPSVKDRSQVYYLSPSVRDRSQVYYLSRSVKERSQVYYLSPSVKERRNIVDPGQMTGLLIIYMYTHKPRSKGRAYDLKNQSQETGDITSILHFRYKIWEEGKTTK